MWRPLGWFCALILAGSASFAPSSATAQQHSTSQIREGFQPTTTQAFAETYPDGKLSIVRQKVDGTSGLLTAAHRLALENDKGRDIYREALVYQAAAQRALDDAQFAEAMYLTLHARSLGRGVIRANTTRFALAHRPDQLELVRRAGQVDTAAVEGYLELAGEDVPAGELLFVD